MTALLRICSTYVATTVCLAAALADEVRSHPPLRTVPHIARRPLPDGPRVVVDAERGDDAHSGSEQMPLRTIQSAVQRAKPGTTIVLRTGTYFEQVRIALRGTSDKPIVLRSWPGEVAVIDGGLPEFSRRPAAAWEPESGGAHGEFRSSTRYPNLRSVVGSFGDSLVGLNTYYHLSDLRAANEFIDYDNWEQAKQVDIRPLYCGPGLWYDAHSGHIHCRLAHTHIPETPNYTGETDPRKLPLIIAPFRSVPVTLDGAAHVRVQDVTIRGAGYDAVQIAHCQHVDFDNVTVWCGTYGMRISGTGPLKLHRCGLYGNCPPWLFRSDTSKRAYPGRPFRDITRLNTHATLVSDSGREFEVYAHPTNDDWEISHCEFADSHDGPYLGGVNLNFHHNLIENTQDDGIYLSPMYPRHLFMGGGAELHIFQNVFRGCLTALAFGGSEDTRDRVFIYRNIFDLRIPVGTGRPTQRTPMPTVSYGKLLGDHGSPPWSAMTIYHNTIVAREPARDASMVAWGGVRADHPRRVFNNIFLHLDRLPAFTPPAANLPIEADGNLYWFPALPDQQASHFFDRYRASAEYRQRKETAPNTVSDHCVIADPKLPLEETGSLVSFQPGVASPAVNAGVTLPAEFPDPLRDRDSDRPDIGALPSGAAIFDVGRQPGH